MAVFLTVSLVSSGAAVSDGTDGDEMRQPEECVTPEKGHGEAEEEPAEEEPAEEEPAEEEPAEEEPTEEEPAEEKPAEEKPAEEEPAEEEPAEEEPAEEEPVEEEPTEEEPTEEEPAVPLVELRREEEAPERFALREKELRQLPGAENAVLRLLLSVGLPGEGPAAVCVALPAGIDPIPEGPFLLAYFGPDGAERMADAAVTGADGTQCLSFTAERSGEYGLALLPASGPEEAEEPEEIEPAEPEKVEESAETEPAEPEEAEEPEEPEETEETEETEALMAVSAAPRLLAAAATGTHTDVSGYLTSTGANAWQIDVQKYEGNSSAYKTATGTDGNVRVQKNVIPTNTENVFLVYLAIDTKTVTEVTRSSYDQYVGDISNFVAGSANIEGKEEYAPGTMHTAPKGGIKTITSGSLQITVRNPSGEIIATGNIAASVPNAGIYLKTHTGKYIVIAATASAKTADVTLTPAAYEELKETITTTSSITTTVSGLSVTDTMGDYMEFLEIVVGDWATTPALSGNVLTWTLAEKPSPSQTTTKEENGSTSVTTTWNLNAAELVYRVQLDVNKAGFEDGKIYDVNKSAVLTYNTGQKAEFPVPAVHGKKPVIPKVKLTVIKYGSAANEGNELAGAEFTLARSGGTEPVAVAASDNTGIVFSALELSPGTYTLRETKAPPGYELAEPVTIVVKADGTVESADYDAGAHALTLRITDRALYTIPETGRGGIYPLLVTGVALMCGTATGGMLLRRRRGGRAAR